MTLKQALTLAIIALKQQRKKYAVSASGDRYGFEFGINARKHFDEYTEALTLLEKLCEEKSK
jgi:hypothetical protein